MRNADTTLAKSTSCSIRPFLDNALFNNVCLLVPCSDADRDPRAYLNGVGELAEDGDGLTRDIIAYKELETEVQLGAWVRGRKELKLMIGAERL